MPDESGTPGADARDEELARLLAVEPLDDLTRQRLVATAMRSTGAARRARMLVAAAAIVMLVVVGAGVVVAIRGTGSDQVTAARDSVRSAASPSAGSGARTPATSSSPVELGDFGELTVAANRQRLFSAIGDAQQSAPSSAAAGAERAASVLANVDCTVRGLPSGTVVAVATGTLDATKVVVVVVTDTAAGTRRVSTVDTGTCRVRPLT